MLSRRFAFPFVAAAVAAVVGACSTKEPAKSTYFSRSINPILTTSCVRTNTGAGCHVADGRADVYPRLAPTSEWDVAAGTALVTAAGGKVTRADGGELLFGRQEAKFLVPDFIAWGDPSAT